MIIIVFKYDSIESIELLDKVAQWTKGLTDKFNKREFKPTVMNTEGKSVLVTRYFREIKPPEELTENGEGSFETAVIFLELFLFIFIIYLNSYSNFKSNIARFVSMIPYVADSLIFPGISDIWSTCDVKLFLDFSLKNLILLG